MHLNLESAGCFLNKDRACPFKKDKNPKSYPGYDHEYKTCKNKFFFKLCRKCDVLILDPRPKKNDLNIIYPSNYHSYILTKEEKKLFDITFFRKKAAFSRFTNAYNFKKLEKKTKILDIGCGNGWMLDLLKEFYGNNAITYGTEINKNVCEAAKKRGHLVKYGLDPFKLFKNEKFDVINITHVIEHLSEPFLLIKDCFKILKNGGIIIIETPNYDSMDRKIINLFDKGSWGGFHFPRHWYLFCEQTVKKISREITNLNVEKVSYFPSPTTWIWSMNNLIQNKIKRKINLFDPIKIFQNSGVSFLSMFFFYLLDKSFLLMGLRTSTVQFVLRKEPK